MSFVGNLIGRSRPPQPPPTTRSRRVKPAPKLHRPVDALDRFVVLTATAKEYRALPPASIPDQTVRLERVVDDAGQISGRAVLPHSFNPLVAPPALLTLGGKPAIRGGAALTAWLSKKGIRVTVTTDGRLVATTSGGRMPLEAREIVRVTAPLVRAHLAGVPLRCGFPHPVPKGKAIELPEAVSLAEPDLVPMCDAHRLGELEP